MRRSRCSELQTTPAGSVVATPQRCHSATVACVIHGGNGHPVNKRSDQIPRHMNGEIVGVFWNKWQRQRSVCEDSGAAYSSVSHETPRREFPGTVTENDETVRLKRGRGLTLHTTTDLLEYE